MTTIRKITQTLRALTVFPKRTDYRNSDYYANAVESWLNEEQQLNAEYRALTPQMNAMAQDMDTLSSEMEGAANAAAGSAVTAGQYKDAAATSAAEAEAAKEVCEAHVAMLPDGAINDTQTTRTNAWSAQEIYNRLLGKASGNHNHDASYLGIDAKAADSDKLDGLDSGAFVKVNYNNVAFEYENDGGVILRTLTNPTESPIFQVRSSGLAPRFSVWHGATELIGHADTNWYIGTNKIWHEGNDGAGSGLDADLLDGYQTSTGAGGNTVAVRDSNGDLQSRLIRSSYQNHTAIASSAGLVFRVSTTDNYLRTASPEAVKAYLESIGVGGMTFLEASNTVQASKGEVSWCWESSGRTVNSITVAYGGTIRVKFTGRVGGGGTAPRHFIGINIQRDNGSTTRVATSPDLSTSAQSFSYDVNVIEGDKIIIVAGSNYNSSTYYVTVDSSSFNFDLTNSDPRNSGLL